MRNVQESQRCKANPADAKVLEDNFKKNTAKRTERKNGESVRSRKPHGRNRLKDIKTLKTKGPQKCKILRTKMYKSKNKKQAKESQICKCKSN